MSNFLQLPSSLQIATLAILGLVIGAFANWCIYSLAWFPRAISPWSAAPAGVPARTLFDRLPVIGWLGLRREESVHGSWFWIRPLILEVLCAVGLVLLFRFEIAGGLLPPGMQLPFVVQPLEGLLLWQFVAHAILLFGLWVSTFIDLDEQTIPDSITVPGALLGIAFSVFSPLPLLPAVIGGDLTFCSVTSPEALPSVLQGSSGLAIACAIMVVWGISLVPALCTLRKGLRKGIAFYCATFFRGGYAYLLLTIVALSCLALAGVAHYLPAAWPAVITSVVGLGFGGGLVWAVRIIGQVALQKEAMGFGDVTLMAMVGAFLGWQAALVIFFLSPVAALVVSLAQWMFSGRRDIAFGPYLSLASLMVIVGWDRVWNGFAREVFALGMLVPVLLGLVLILMMGLLMLWRIIEQKFFAPRES